MLAPKRIAYSKTLIVQISGGLVNRMLPAGLGNMGIMALYLRRFKHSLPVALAVVSTNNMLGFAGNALLLLCTLLVLPVPLNAIAGLKTADFPWQALAAASLVLITAVSVLAGRRGIAENLRRTVSELGGYARSLSSRPAASLIALGSSCMLTALHAGGLYAVMLAVNTPVSWPVALIAISAGAFAGALSPTPGGIGGAEAGIAGVLMAYGVPAGASIAAALVYRGITFWMPLLPGYLALRIVEKRYL